MKGQKIVEIGLLPQELLAAIRVAGVSGGWATVMFAFMPGPDGSTTRWVGVVDEDPDFERVWSLVTAPGSPTRPPSAATSFCLLPLLRRPSPLPFDIAIEPYVYSYLACGVKVVGVGTSSPFLATVELFYRLQDHYIFSDLRPDAGLTMAGFKAIESALRPWRHVRGWVRRVDRRLGRSSDLWLRIHMSSRFAEQVRAGRRPRQRHPEIEYTYHLDPPPAGARMCTVFPG